MRTSGPLYPASRGNCMRKLCAKAVDNQWEACGVEHNLCTGVAANHEAACAQAAVSAPTTTRLYPRFPQAFFGNFPLLTSPFSPQSTTPITITTIYIN